MKKFLPAFIALIFAATTAFTTYRPIVTYKFNGTSTLPAHRVNPSMYSNTTQTGCSGTEEVFCSLTADEDPITGEPAIGTSGLLYDALRNANQTKPNFGYTGIQGKP